MGSVRLANCEIFERGNFIDLLIRLMRLVREWEFSFGRKFCILVIRKKEKQVREEEWKGKEKNKGGR